MSGQFAKLLQVAEQRRQHLKHQARHQLCEASLIAAIGGRQCEITSDQGGLLPHGLWTCNRGRRTGGSICIVCGDNPFLSGTGRTVPDPFRPSIGEVKGFAGHLPWKPGLGLAYGVGSARGSGACGSAVPPAWVRADWSAALLCAWLPIGRG